MELPDIPESNDPKNIFKMRMDLGQVLILVVMIGGGVLAWDNIKQQIALMDVRLNGIEGSIVDSKQRLDNITPRIQHLEDKQERMITTR